jgi:hypothetical protein
MRNHSFQLAKHLTVPEYAKIKGVSTTTVYNALEDKRICAVYVGKSRIALIDPRFLHIEFRKKNKINL